MIPTHNTGAFLRTALDSVLAQDQGPAHMDIEVVDDGSTTDDPERLVREFGDGRIRLHRNPRNLGPTATFNECLRRARGEWIHLLHGDDAVLPGFYAACDRIIAENPDVVMVIGQVIMIDESGRWLTLTGPPPSRAGGPFVDFLLHQATAQVAQFAGTAVRRDAYEAVGGFCTRFHHVADRDMWFRVGQYGLVWCTDRPYGLYRVHAGADTGRHVRQGTDVEEMYLSTRINLQRLGLADDAPAVRGWRANLSRRASRNAIKLRARGLPAGALIQARWAWRLHPTPKTAALLVHAWLRARVMR